MTFHELIKQSIKTLSTIHPDTAEIEVYHLLSYCFEYSRHDIIQRLNEPIVCVDSLTAFNNALLDRMKHKPLDLIISTSQFFDKEYDIEAGVLIPRAETEIVVNTAITMCRSYFQSQSFVGFELGIGSGVMSIELASQFPKSRLYGYDISEQAINVAKRNIKKHQIQSIEVIHKDFFDSNWKIHRVPKQPFLILSNPPYIPTKEIALLDISVQRYDPISALDGGADGLDIYRQLIQEVAPYTCLIVLEMGHGQAKSIQEIVCKKMKNAHVSCVKDNQNIDRVMVIKNK